MGTTDRSVDKKSSEKIADAAKAMKQKANKLTSVREIMQALGMNYHRTGKGEKKYENLNTSDPKYKKRKRTLQKQSRKANRK